jgi:hypothetical protein
MRRTAVLCSLLVACGGSSISTGNATDTTAAQRAMDPRENDPTAASANGIPENPNALKLGGKSTPTKPLPPPEMVQPPAGDLPEDAPKKIGARHVLIQWMGADHAGGTIVRTKDQALAVAQEVLQRARAGEDVGRLAVEFSDEPGASQRGGSLGRFGRGQMVPAFENAAFRLKVGEISGIVESPFGYHIIQRTE